MSRKTSILTALIFVIISMYAQLGPKDKIIEPKYLFQEFSSGEVYLKDGSVITAPLNLNTLNQEILFKKDTATLMLNMPNAIDSVVISNRVFIPYGKAFYEFVFGTKLKLLVQNKTRWDTKNLAGYGYSKLAKTTVDTQFSQSGLIIPLDSGVEIEYYDDSEHFISKEKTFLIASKVKNYCVLCPDMKEVIRSFVKDNKLNLKRKNDQLKLVFFINKTLKRMELRK